MKNCQFLSELLEGFEGNFDMAIAAITNPDLRGDVQIIDGLPLEGEEAVVLEDWNDIWVVRSDDVFALRSKERHSAVCTYLKKHGLRFRVYSPAMGGLRFVLDHLKEDQNKLQAEAEKAEALVAEARVQREAQKAERLAQVLPILRKMDLANLKGGVWKPLEQIVKLDVANWTPVTQEFEKVDEEHWAPVTVTGDLPVSESIAFCEIHSKFNKAYREAIASANLKPGDRKGFDRATDQFMRSKGFKVFPYYRGMVMILRCFGRAGWFGCFLLSGDVPAFMEVLAEQLETRNRASAEGVSAKLNGTKSAEEILQEWKEQDLKKFGPGHPGGCLVKSDFYRVLLVEELFNMPFEAHKAREAQRVQVSFGEVAKRDRSGGYHRPQGRSHGANGWDRLKKLD